MRPPETNQIFPRSFFLRGLLRVAQLGGSFVLLGTAGQIVAPRWWVADVATQFTVQYLLILSLLVPLMMMARRWRWVLVFAVCWIVNAALVQGYLVPRTTAVRMSERSGAGSTLADHESLVVLTQNVLASNTQYDDVIRLIRVNQPDIIALQEVTAEWMGHLTAALADQYPYRVFADHDGNFGAVVFSRIGWEATDVQRFEPTGIPVIHVRFRMDDGRLLEFVNVHPVTPAGQRYSDDRNGLLLTTVASMDPKAIRMVAGDFNLTPWSPWFRELLRRGEFRDAAVGHGIQPTWYAFPGLFGGLMIDHLLVSREIGVHSCQAGNFVGSDHRALVVKVRFID